MFANRLIVADSLESTQDGARFQIRLNWYRSLPLASLKILDVAIDGQPVPPSHLSVTIDGRRYGLDEVGELIDTWWYVLDPATVELTLEHPLVPGEHQVFVRLGSRVPYIIIGPTIDDTYAVTDEATTTLVA